MRRQRAPSSRSANLYPPDRAPDSIEPIAGWRLWLVCQERAGLRLRSIVLSGRPWEPRQRFEARCHHRCDSPGFDCGCGINAASSVTLLRPYVGWTAAVPNTVVCRAFGKVSLWGRVVVCKRGWRGQYAYPRSIALLRTGETPDDLNLHDVAHELRETYDVTVLTR